jgi:hypothetical protein
MAHTSSEMLTFIYRTSKNYRVISVQFSGPLLHMTAISTDFHCIKFVRYNFKVPHGHHICHFLTEKVYRFQLVDTTFVFQKQFKHNK